MLYEVITSTVVIPNPISPNGAGFALISFTVVWFSCIILPQFIMINHYKYEYIKFGVHVLIMWKLPKKESKTKKFKNFILN